MDRPKLPVACDPPIYLDHAATTPIDPEVAEAMLPYLQGPLSGGNPSSIHSFGRAARAAIDLARDQVAQWIGASYGEIYFTGSGTEADNLALTGAMLAGPNGRNQLVTTPVEHHAVLHTARALKDRNFDIDIAAVDSVGRVTADAISELVSERTTLVSVMHANNEIGTIQPIEEIGALARSRGALFHTDAVQSAGLLPIDFRSLSCDLMSVSAHKIYGPKGVGAVAIRQGTAVSPIIYGGSQEREKRAGTENVAAIVGFGKAAEVVMARRSADAGRLAELAEGFIANVMGRIPTARLNGPTVGRLPNNVNISIEGVEGPTLLMSLDRRGIAASSGSACSSGSIEPSHVLKAIGLPDSLASSGVRFSLGRSTSAEDLARVVDILASIVEALVGRRRP